MKHGLSRFNQDAILCPFLSIFTIFLSFHSLKKEKKNWEGRRNWRPSISKSEVLLQ